MKTKMLTILGVVAVLHLVVIGVITLSGGCRHPEVLRERNNVPPPSLLPPDEQPQPVIQKKVIKEAPPPQTNVLPEPPIAPVEPTKKQVEKKILPEAKLLTHKVKQGESLWLIARQYGVSAGELAAANNMSVEKAKSLRVGTVLTIPPGGAPVPADKLPKIEPQKHKSGPAPKSSSSSKPAITKDKEPVPTDGAYVVKSGDSLWKIAVKHGVSSKDIADANKLDPSKPLQVGQKIIIPVGGKSSVKASSSQPKTVADIQIKVDEKAVLDAEVKPKKDDLDKMLGVPGEESKGLSANETAKKPNLEDSPAALNPEDAPIVVDDIVATPPANVEFILHESIDGETVESIASIYSANVEDILSLNPGLKRGVKLNSGMSLKIPKGK